MCSLFSLCIDPFRLVLVLCVCVLGGGSRWANPVRDTGSKRLRNPGEVPEGSSASKRNVKSIASKHKEPARGMDEIGAREYVRIRQLHPYATPRSTIRGCELFWNKTQTQIYLDVIKNKQNTYVEVKWIEMHHMRKDKFRDYFGEALDLVEQFAIEHVISFHMDYDPEIICQFFASVYFHTNDERRMTWMTNGRQLSATWKEFMELLQVADDGLDTPVGVRPHGNTDSADKDKLTPFMVEKKLATGKIVSVLNPFLDIMYRIFRNSLFPRIGDKDKVHAYMVDMMLLCEEARSSQTQPLDVSHIMWCELRFAVFNRKVPIYGPYLFLLISKTWEKMYPTEEFLAPDWIRHEPICLRVKPNWANTATRAEASAARAAAVDEDAAGAEDVAGGRSARPTQSDSRPSWAKRLTDKMKSLFCMQAKGQYRAHVESKESRRRHNKILKLYGEDVSAGSEEHITPETEWMEKQGFKWTDSAEEAEESIPAAEESDAEEWDSFSA